MLRAVAILRVLLLTLALPALPAQARAAEVTLRVDGLACPFCAYGLEKKLRQLEGYASLEVFMNQGKVTVGWREDKPLDLEALHDAVRKAGFTLREVQGRFIGAVVREDGAYWLVLPPPVDQRFSLYEPAARRGHAGEGSTPVFTPSCRNRLDRAVAEEMMVEIVGPVHGHEDPALPPAIGIEGLEVLSLPNRA